MTGYNTRVAGTTITASADNTDVRDQVVSTFATISARDAAITVPVEGFLAYTKAEDVVWYYNGTAWVKASSSAWASLAARDSGLTASLAKAEGDITYLQDVNTLQAYTGSATSWSTIGPVHGALASSAWSPAIVQGATPTVTINNRTVTRVGRLVIAHFFVTITSAGTANTVVTITLPFTAAQSAGPIGTGYIWDTSAAARCDGVLHLASSTTAKLGNVASGTGNLYLGEATANFNAALASGDQMVGFMVYEAAADA